MVLLEDIPQPEDGFYVVITGANSGLGLGIGCRLIDEFLHTRPQSQSLVLITTTRDRRKGDETVRKLREHLRTACRKLERTLPGISMVVLRRVHFRPEILDLTSLVSVQRLCKRLRETTPKLDAVICNAGIGGWTGLNWLWLVWKVLTDCKNAVTWPSFKLAGVGKVTKPQTPSAGEEPQLGEVFCANFFGHYLLGHHLAPLLARHPQSEDARGRLIWVSSIEAHRGSLDMKDIQGLESLQPYESSKRLQEVMAITSRLPSSAPLADQYLEHAGDGIETTRPRMYVSHPGICGTAIYPMAMVLEYLMLVVFHVARWLGSPWHPITAYKGACSAVWLALEKQSMLDSMEAREGVAKWGSATDVWGQERVERTEVDGWGWGGTVGERRRKGRRPGAADLTAEERRAFEQTGRECWVQMERLRVEWEQRLADAGVGVPMD